jgi:hypothetical protein
VEGEHGAGFESALEDDLVMRGLGDARFRAVVVQDGNVRALIGNQGRECFELA